MIASFHVDTLDSKFFLCIPDVPGGTNGLNMVPLRELLQSRGRLREAGLILNFELGFQPSQIRSQETCRSLIEACSSSASGHEPVWYVESKARIQLAKSLNGLGQHEQAAMEFELAKDLLQQAPVPAALNRTEMRVRFDQLQSSADIDLHNSLNKWTDCVKSLSETEDSSELCIAWEKVSAVAGKILESDASDENRERFRELQSHKESMLERLGDIYTIYLHRSTWPSNLSQNHTSAADILKWQQDFDLKHPSFHKMWDLEIEQKRAAFYIYKQLKDLENVNKTIDQIYFICRSRDKFWSSVDKHYTLQTQMGQDQISGLGSEERTNEAFRPNGMRDMWHSEWDKELIISSNNEEYAINEGEFYPKRADSRLKTLLQWLSADSASGDLSKGGLERILIPLCESVSTGSRIQTFNGIFVKRRGAQNEDEEAEVDSLLGKLNPTSLEIQLFGTEGSLPSSAHWKDAFAVLRDWLFQGAKYNEAKRHSLLLDLQIQMYEKVTKTGSLSQQAMEVQNILDLLPTLCTEAQGRWSLWIWRNILCGIKSQALSREENIEARFEDHPKFREIADLYEITLNEVQVHEGLYSHALTSAAMASLYSFAACKLRPGAMEPFFRYCNIAEQSFQKSRESWKLLRGWEKVQNLLNAVQVEGFRHRLAASAVVVLSRFPDSDRVERDQRIWTTVQKEKSWGLGWLMQTNSLQGTEDVPVGKSAISDFEASPVITVDDLQSIGSDTEGGVVYVDWYDGRRSRQCNLDSSYSSNVVLLTVSNGESPKSWQLDITWADVDAAVKRFLQCDEEKEFRRNNARKQLRKLDPLVQPLRQVSKPGQVLVFSAIGDLHCIPLHALNIDGEVLIRRNPIVYCSSMTVLNVVFRQRKTHEEKAKDDGRAFGVSLCFGDLSSTGEEKSREDKLREEKSRDSLVRIFATKEFKKETFKDKDLTPDAFEDAIRRPGLDFLHYHGHAYYPKDQSQAGFNITDSLDHSLALNEENHFKLRRVFELGPLSNSHHATLLGCGSGKSRTSTSNDVVGLVSAFLYSGASSTVSALWTKIDGKDASMYSQHFYSHFKHALENKGDSRFINLAMANQKAVLEIMDERPGLYHWAPFVLNGYWMYHIPVGSLGEGAEGARETFER